MELDRYLNFSTYITKFSSLFCRIPLLFMELAVGQYTRRGPIGALEKMCPILKGEITV